MAKSQVHQVAFTIRDLSDINYSELLDKVILSSLKEGEMPNRSEWFRKIVLREAKKVGLL